MEWSSEVVMEFLDLYESEPSIWNPQDPDRKDRNMVHDAWKRIQSSLSIDCSLTELKKKKENLMATYRKVAMKVIKKAHAPNGNGDPYKPEWFAYEKMDSFLHSIYTPRKTKTSIEGTENEVDEKPVIRREIPDPVEPCDVSYPRYDEEIQDAETAVEGRCRPPKQVGEGHKPAEDESSIFCNLLFFKLSSLGDDTREIAMHEINNLLSNFIKPEIQQPTWNRHTSQQPGCYSNSLLRTVSWPLEVSCVEKSWDSEWTEEGALKLIQYFGERGCLWDPSRPDYRSKSKREGAWREISHLLQVGVADAKKKMESLMEHFRGERQREESTEEDYKSKWFALRSMDFLRDTFAAKLNANSEEVSCTSDVSSSASATTELTTAQGRGSCGIELEDRWSKKRMRLTTEAGCSSDRTRNEPEAGWPRKRTRADESDWAEEDDCAAFAKSSGLELRAVADPGQRDLAKRLISEVIFLAKRGKLSFESRIQLL